MYVVRSYNYIIYPQLPIFLPGLMDSVMDNIGRVGSVSL